MTEPPLKETGESGPIDVLHGSAPRPGDDSSVELTLSVKEDLLVLARLTTSTVAARSGFDIEEIEDLRLAVDELCLHVLQGRRAGRLHITFAADDGHVDIWCHFDGPDPTSEDELQEEGLLDLSARILEALVDEHGASTHNGLSGAYFCKRRSRPDE